MGLAAAKNKRKLGNDPNNTKWSRNTDSFGQKILRSQGWQPGEYLGAKDAPHAEWHTEANTTHIRVVLKDDTLGLGAKRNNGDECTGLDAFQHLLGRLNGKSDETLEAEQKVREDVKLSLYMERKFGTIRFVKGGWLVGDQVKETPDDEIEKAQNGSASEAQMSSADVSEDSEPAAVKSKKRKADQDTDREDDKARKKEKKSKKRKTDAETDVDIEGGKKKKDKKSKRRRTESEEGDEKSTESPDEVDGCFEAKRAKKEKKKDKKDKKEKKEKRRKDKEASESGVETGDSISKEKKRRKKDATAETSPAPTPAESSMPTPSGSGYSTPVPTSSRYLARSRFIAQKKLAFADSAALNQIFMIKS
ncbi:protein PXR1 [Parachaetomium inaequale]|uniref:PinX1-related protein 1 n=1 Tax=Parachaetomium inaequale TaxID=2588326 RepID=A0AAN6PR60_9PEZI|nr:protein PXR1 [Parachaetomium inaequale]